MSTAEHVDIAKANSFATLVIKEDTFAEVPEEVECPWELEHIWGYFCELDGTRQTGGMGFNPITHVEMTAWAEGMGVTLTPFERNCIRVIDDAYRVHCNKKEK